MNNNTLPYINDLLILYVFDHLYSIVLNTNYFKINVNKCKIII